MKIGVLLPIGRTDRYGYQYKEYNKLIINNLAKFSDCLMVISSSRYVNKDLFENHSNIEFISNKNTWFKLIDGDEVFEAEKISQNLNFCCKKFQKTGYNVVILLAINQYVPKTSEKKLRKSCQNMLEKNMPYIWLYKKYLCGNLLFNADRKLPWIINLTIDNLWKISHDSLIDKKSGEIVKIQTGNFKKYNNQAIIDVPWITTIHDAKEKYEFVIKEYRIINKTYNPNDPSNLKFNEDEWIRYTQRKINLKSLAKEELDDVAIQIQKLRKKDFVSHIFEKNYNPISKSIIKKILNKIYKLFK